MIEKKKKIPKRASRKYVQRTNGNREYSSYLSRECGFLVTCFQCALIMTQNRSHLLPIVSHLAFFFVNLFALVAETSEQRGGKI